MERNSRLLRGANRVLGQYQGRKKGIQSSPALTFRNNLNALRLDNKTGAWLIDKLKVPSAVSRLEYFKALCIHKCLQYHPKYVPVMHANVDDTVVHILNEANRIMPQYTLLISDVNYDTINNLADIAKSISDDSTISMRSATDNLYFPSSAPELVMEYDVLYELFKERGPTDSLFRLLSNALSMLHQCGIDDITGNSPWDQSAENVLHPQGEHYEDTVDNFIEQYKEICGKEESKKGFKKEANKWARQQMAELYKTEKEKREFYNKYINSKKESVVDDRLVSRFLANADNMKNYPDLFSWITHIWNMRDQEFYFPKYIIIEESEESYPIRGDQVIGLAFSLQDYIVIRSLNELEAYQNEYGFAPIGGYTMVNSVGEYYSEEDRPIVAMLRKALQFNLKTLRYERSNTNHTSEIRLTDTATAD